MKYIERLFIICCCLGLLIACDEESAPLLFDETTEDFQLYDYYIDQYGNEGFVGREKICKRFDVVDEGCSGDGTRENALGTDGEGRPFSER